MKLTNLSSFLQQKLKFDDELTSIFEYPSESSLLEDTDSNGFDVGSSGGGGVGGAVTKLIGSMPMGKNDE